MRQVMIRFFAFLFLATCLIPLAKAQELPGGVKQRIKALFETQVRAKQHGPGYAVAVVKGQQVKYQGNFGLANLDYQLPITSNSAFDIASVSKQFTAACIALLIMDGRVDLNMPASRFIPELAKYKDTIRISHLLYNTSGIPDYYKLPRGGGRSWVTFDYFTIDDCIHSSLGPDTLAFSPGTKWDYCNTNFMLLTKIVEKISGEPFREFARKRLFLPLGMTHTLVNDDATTVIPNRVTPYNERNKTYVDAYRKEGFAVNYGAGWIQHPRNSPHYGGSGINTTMNDLVKWEENFFSKRFGGERFYQLMHRTQPFKNGMDNQAFGLYSGSYKGHTYWAWDGGDYGVSAQIIRFPKSK
jgi:CubicO group peptidase (beta-lactamase class C family)